MEKRINEQFDILSKAKSVAFDSQRTMDRIAENAKMENLDEWVAAKNNDVRHALILRALADNEEYHAARKTLLDAQHVVEVTELEVKRIRYLLDAARSSAAQL